MLKFMSETRNFEQFVSHRIGEILEVTEVRDWFWVPTTDNVADDATRGGDDVDFSPTSRWLNGPAFLKADRVNWPKERSLVKVELPMDEMKKTLVGVVTQSERFRYPRPQRFSSWEKALRTSA
ncbi:unnamed protein product [Allacma fusca]|uniref:Uncharacterized protein n=1 Tax=Allacma fusca TaxID=39272 RepID=A0A8J2LRG7_9HEXA|nr:unnamed protein product [Allacma fusca]